MYKIYSRRRFIIGRNLQNKKRKSFNKISKNKDKILKIIVIMIIAIETINLLLNYIDPIYKKKCIEEAKSLATIVTNEQSTIVIKKYQYEDIFSYEKDNDGNITMIKTNMYQINMITSDIGELIQKNLNNATNQRNLIEIPIGSFSGLAMLSGVGPKVKLKVELMGNVDTELKSEFISQGINQTLHRVYLQIYCNTQILSSYKNLNATISNQVLLLENVIVGKIPSNYYNLQGLEGYQDALNALP